MMTEKRVLYITKHNPWGRGGGSTASLMYLNAFIKVFDYCMIDLCIADGIDDCCIVSDVLANPLVNIIKGPPRGKISKLISPFSGVMHRYQSVCRKLLRMRCYTHCVFDHSSIGGTLLPYVPKDVKTIIIHHNYEPVYFSDNTTDWILRKALLPSVKKAEKIAFKYSDVNVFLTEEDKKQFKEIYGANKGINIVTGLFNLSDNPHITPVKTLKLYPPTIVITGSLNNVQNIDGIRYFFSELYPLIPKGYHILIAGQHPDEEVKRLVMDKGNVTLIPNPSCMDDVVKKGNIFLSPARVGGGIKVRVTDGLRAGLPVIAHEVSSRGYGRYIEKGYFLPFKSPEEFGVKLDEICSKIRDGKFSSIEISSFYADNSSQIKVVKLLQGLLLS